MKGAVISLLEFFSLGEEFHWFYWLVRLSQDHEGGTFMASAGGRGYVGFELLIRHIFLHLLCFLRSKQHFLFFGFES